MSLNAQILLSVLAHESESGDISRTLRATPAAYAMTLSDGTGANQAQVVWSDSRTVASTPDDIDLAAISDDRGTVAFSSIKAAYIKNTHASSQLDIIAGDAVANSWAGFGYGDEGGASSLMVAPGGVAFIANPTAAGAAVSASLRILRINATPGVTYDIVLIGEGTVT
jgi:hypothetical protein